MIEPAFPDAKLPAAPRRLRRLLARGAATRRDLAAAIARDALELVPQVEQSVATLDDGTEVRARRSARSDSPDLIHMLDSSDGRLGQVALWLAHGAAVEAATHFAAAAIGWAAAAVSERSHRTRLQSRLDATIASTPIGIAHIVQGGRFALLNDRFCEITGHSREALLREGFAAVIHPGEIRTGRPQLEALMAGEIDHYTAERRYLRPDKSVVWVAVTVTLIRDAAGAADYFVLAIEDVSEVKRARDEAERDPLTGLLNRRGLLEYLERDRLRCIERQQPFTLIYVDLDDFKQINDRLGHATGDRCMIAAAEAIWRTVGSRGRLARVGGDEFVIALADVDDAQGTILTERLRRALGEVEVAPGWTMSASVGHATAGAGDGMSADDLLAAADSVMFHFKNQRSAPSRGLESGLRAS